MAKKQSQKRKFDWTTYSRPARLLTPGQQEAFGTGMLRPLLAQALEREHLSMQIRARSAHFYFRGSSLLRVSGESPYIAEFDVSHRLPKAQRSGEVLERITLESTDDVEACVRTLQELAEAIDAEWTAEDFADRTARQAFAEANSGADLFADEYVVVDIDYTYGQRRYDFIALQRVEGVTGPGGFANCEIAFGALCHAAIPSNRTSALATSAGDFAEMAKAAGAMHLPLIRSEVEALVRQKVELGLLPEDLELRAVEEGLPQLLVVFAGDHVASQASDQAIIELHDKLTARHFPTEHLKLAHVPALESASPSEVTLHEGDAVSYRAFKAYRKSLRPE